MVDLPRGRIKERPEDFQVEEIPAYPPSGSGEHVFVRFTKRNLTTTEAVTALARACGCDPREAGFAGMKDKRAITRQTASLRAPRGVDPAEVAERARTLSLPGIDVAEAIPHGNKLKPGHLEANRFEITVRGVSREHLAAVECSFERIGREGVPNRFGEQRFGSSGDNAARARAWLTGQARGPRDARTKRLLWSSLQSAAFNDVLQARVDDGTWTVPMLGDLLKLRASGGMFVCTAVQTDGERALRGELSPTGPIIGARMRWPEGRPAEIEREIVGRCLGEEFDLASTRRLGEGSRRALRLWVEDLRWEVLPEPASDGAVGVRVYFVLPKGGYATTVLGGALRLEQTGDPGPVLPAADDEQSGTTDESMQDYGAKASELTD